MADMQEALADDPEAAPPYYAVSTFGAVKEPGVDVETLMMELAASIPRRSNWIVFAGHRELEAEGFPVRQTEPPPGHYDAILGDALRNEDIARLHAVFDRYERRRFPTCQVP